MGLCAKKGDCILILCECEKATRVSKSANPEAPLEFKLALYNFLHIEFGLFDFKQGKNVCKTIAFQCYQSLRLLLFLAGRVKWLPEAKREEAAVLFCKLLFPADSSKTPHREGKLYLCVS